jgi:hypothetical protein
MRADSMRAWRSRAAIAIVIGLFGGLGLGGYALFVSSVNGLASLGCQGGGCEARFAAQADHYDLLLDIALFGGGGLIVAGIATRRVLGKRLRELEPPPLPVASVVKDADSGWKI